VWGPSTLIGPSVVSAGGAVVRHGTTSDVDRGPRPADMPTDVAAATTAAREAVARAMVGMSMMTCRWAESRLVIRVENVTVMRPDRLSFGVSCWYLKTTLRGQRAGLYSYYIVLLREFETVMRPSPLSKSVSRARV